MRFHVREKHIRRPSGWSDNPRRIITAKDRNGPIRVVRWRGPDGRRCALGYRPGPQMIGRRLWKTRLCLMQSVEETIRQQRRGMPIYYTLDLQ